MQVYILFHISRLKSDLLKTEAGVIKYCLVMKPQGSEAAKTSLKTGEKSKFRQCTFT